MRKEREQKRNFSIAISLVLVAAMFSFLLEPTPTGQSVVGQERLFGSPINVVDSPLPPQPPTTINANSCDADNTCETKNINSIGKMTLIQANSVASQYVPLTFIRNNNRITSRDGTWDFLLNSDGDIELKTSLIGPGATGKWIFKAENQGTFETDTIIANSQLSVGGFPGLALYDNSPSFTGATSGSIRKLSNNGLKFVPEHGSGLSNVIDFTREGNLKLENLEDINSGFGRFLCVDRYGEFFASKVPCDQVQVPF